MIKLLQVAFLCAAALPGCAFAQNGGAKSPPNEGGYGLGNTQRPVESKTELAWTRKDAEAAERMDRCRLDPDCEDTETVNGALEPVSLPKKIDGIRIEEGLLVKLLADAPDEKSFSKLLEQITDCDAKIADLSLRIQTLKSILAAPSTISTHPVF